MTYGQKVETAQRIIGTMLGVAKNPVVACSFGKDSLVVLDLVRKIRKLKVVFYRLPFQHIRHEYADKIIRALDLHVIDYPPTSTAMSENENETNVVNFHQIGTGVTYLPIGLQQEERGADTLCALSEIYGRPTGTFAFPFDAIFHGHKACDIDPVAGPAPIYTDVSTVGSTQLVYPIRQFTDEDVWRYIEENELPINRARYEKVDGKWRSKADRSRNPDYVSCCYACITKKTGANVHCPKYGLTVSNVSNQLRWAPRIDLSQSKG